jgi:hypothetical protein
VARPRKIATSLVLAAGAIGFAPASSADQAAVGIGIGLPGFAFMAGVPVVIAPPAYYHGPAYYGPAVAGGPLYGCGYYSRPYVRYAPRVYAHGYLGPPYYPAQRPVAARPRAAALTRRSLLTPARGLPGEPRRLRLARPPARAASLTSLAGPDRRAPRSA